MSSSAKTKLLQGAVQKAAKTPSIFVAALIDTWQRSFPNESPGEALGCDQETLMQLALCLRPRERNWFEDTKEIASVIGLDPTRLVAFFRAAESVERLSI